MLSVTRTGGQVRVQASWNGATGVQRWVVLAGSDARHLRVLGTVAYTGFRMTQSVAVGRDHRVLTVRAFRSGAASVQADVTAAP